MIELIVNADDLGLDEGVDAAIVAGFAEGWLSASSLLAVGPTCGAVRGLPVGVHLAGTGFAPLTDLGAGLRDAAGNMAVPLHPTEAEVVAVAREWRAQIARVRALGFRPTHLDSHEHLHFWPRWFALLRALARENDLPMRVPGIFAPGGRPSPRAMLRRLRLGPARGPDHFGSASCLRRAWGLRGRVEMMVHPGRPGALAEEIAWLRAGMPGFPPARLVGW